MSHRVVRESKFILASVAANNNKFWTIKLLDNNELVRAAPDAARRGGLPYWTTQLLLNALACQRLSSTRRASADLRTNALCAEWMCQPSDALVARCRQWSSAAWAPMAPSRRGSTPAAPRRSATLSASARPSSRAGIGWRRCWWAITRLCAASSRIRWRTWLCCSCARRRHRRSRNRTLQGMAARQRSLMGAPAQHLLRMRPLLMTLSPALRQQASMRAPEQLLLVPRLLRAAAAAVVRHLPRPPPCPFQ